MNEANVLGLAFGLLCCLGLPAVLFVLPLLVGLRRRRDIRAQLANREPRVAHLMTSTTAPVGGVRHVCLVTGSVVYAADAPSAIAASWRTLVGGRAESLRVQADLARRMAACRALEAAQQAGARGVANLRFETSDVQSSQGNRGKPVIEILAYGTAWIQDS